MLSTVEKKRNSLNRSTRMKLKHLDKQSEYPSTASCSLLQIECEKTGSAECMCSILHHNDLYIVSLQNHTQLHTKIEQRRRIGECRNLQHYHTGFEKIVERMG